jgi:hypothetical protein
MSWNLNVIILTLRTAVICPWLHFPRNDWQRKLFHKGSWHRLTWQISEHHFSYSIVCQVCIPCWPSLDFKFPSRPPDWC